jgi:hypothetical protein
LPRNWAQREADAILARLADRDRDRAHPASRAARSAGSRGEAVAVAIRLDDGRPEDPVLGDRADELGERLEEVLVRGARDPRRGRLELDFSASGC